MTSPADENGGLPDIRVGDRERDQAIEELREHYALGRLDQSEFEQRLEAAVAARTAPELRQLVADLPTGAQPVDWRPGRAVDRADRDPQLSSGPDAWQRRRPRASRHWHAHGRWAHGGGRPYPRHPYRRGPGLLPLLPIVGVALLFGGWAVLVVLPVMICGLLFSVIRNTAWLR